MEPAYIGRKFIGFLITQVLVFTAFILVVYRSGTYPFDALVLALGSNLVLYITGNVIKNNMENKNTKREDSNG